jgi:Major Facilitator Superfamily
MKEQTAQSEGFTSYQKLVVFLLAITQFTVILDFMVMSPLGDIMMKTLNISSAQFGVAVSAYAFSAGISGLLTAGFADKFDRKKLLLFFYIGFAIGTLFCALAPNYPLLVAARILTGIFGGVIGSISMAIVADLFSIQQRGKTMGFIQMGFGVSHWPVHRQPLGLAHAFFVDCGDGGAACLCNIQQDETHPGASCFAKGANCIGPFVAYGIAAPLQDRFFGHRITVYRRFYDDAFWQCLCHQQP